ncbi:MAG: hypothetical protein DRI94_14775 [Bacteroidetes bacterium]|nr:MAG: hypothetical protein DRI94_14775 [Bacteroidota bacterium]
MILNSTANKNKIITELNKYNTVFLFLDNDNTGNQTAKLFSENHATVIIEQN